MAEGTEVSINPDEVEEQQDEGSQDDLLAGKFKSQDELVKAYKELESKLGGGSEDTAEEEDTSTMDESPTDRTDGTIDTSEPEDAEPFTLQNVAEELAENDELADETYERLENEKGMTRADVDAWIEGIRARGDKLVSELADVAGGREEFNQLLDWAKGGLPKEEVQAYNDAVQSGNATLAKMLLRSMKAGYVESEGQDPNLISGENTPKHRGSKPFKSIEQLVAAQGDARYANDPDYRDSVDARIAATDWL